MLSMFRKGIVSKLMLVILAIGLFAIVITGFGTDGMGGIGGLAGGGSTLASVEGEAITSEEASDQVQRQLKRMRQQQPGLDVRSEEHTSELQSQSNLVCRLLLEKK